MNPQIYFWFHIHDLAPVGIDTNKKPCKTLKIINQRTLILYTQLDPLNLTINGACPSPRVFSGLQVFSASRLRSVWRSWRFMGPLDTRGMFLNHGNYLLTHTPPECSQALPPGNKIDEAWDYLRKLSRNEALLTLSKIEVGVDGYSFPCIIQGLLESINASGEAQSRRWTRF